MFPVGPELHTLPQFGFSVLFVAGSGVATVPYDQRHGCRGATSSSSATFVRPWSSKFLPPSARRRRRWRACCSRRGTCSSTLLVLQRVGRRVVDVLEEDLLCVRRELGLVLRLHHREEVVRARWPTCHSMLNGWPRLIWMSGCEKRWRGGHGFVIESFRVRERGALIQL